MTAQAMRAVLLAKATAATRRGFRPRRETSMVIVVNSNRKKPVGAVATASEAEALYRSMVAYAGT